MITNAVWSVAAGVLATRTDTILNNPPQWDIRAIAPSAQFGDALASLAAGCGQLCYGAPVRNGDFADDDDHTVPLSSYRYRANQGR